MCDAYCRKVRRELTSPSFWRDVVTEGVATFFLVSIQCAVPLAWVAGSANGTVPDEISTTRIILNGVSMGFVILVLAEAFGEFGGAHMNPAVSVSMMVATKITVLRGILYIVLQCAGGIAGAGLIYGMTPEQYRESLANTHVNPALQLWQGVIVEAWLTSLLLFAIYGSTNLARRKVFMPAIPIGLTVGLDIMTGVKYTGASMNPARSLGPAVVMSQYEDLWVYWVGPIAGGLIATAIYHALNAIGRPTNAYEVDGEDSKL